MGSSRPRCLACEGSLRLFGPRLGYEYHQCLRCGSLQLHPVPDPEELASAYRSEGLIHEGYESDPDRCRQSARRYYESVLAVLRDSAIDGPIVDYGTGWGGLLELLRAEGYPAFGLEMSREMVAHCRGRGLDVREGGFEELQGLPEPLSAIVLCAVFEHLVDHRDWLTRAASLLREDGRIVSLQPTAPFATAAGMALRLGRRTAELPRLHQFFVPPWHVAFFSIDGMDRLATRSGLELIDVRPAPQGREGGWIGMAQASLELVNRFAWKVAGRRWPLVPAHIFVLRKASRRS